MYIGFYVTLNDLMNITSSVFIQSEICAKLEWLSLYKIRAVETSRDFDMCASLSLILTDTEIDNSFLSYRRFQLFKSIVYFFNTFDCVNDFRRVIDNAEEDVLNYIYLLIL